MPRTTTPKSPPLRDRFEPPDRLINELALHDHLHQIITAENFSTLIASNFLVALDAFDRRLTRDSFEEVLVTTFNFQNRLVRIAELNMIAENIEEGKDLNLDEIKLEVDRHMATAAAYQAKLCATLRLFQEMRSPEDTVS